MILNMLNKKDYYLMHKNKMVCILHISPNGDMTLGEKNFENSDHFPIGGKLSDSKFAEWWKNRYIPQNRKGIVEALKANGYTSQGSALVDNLALTLTDCYWIKPRESDLTWEDVNLFANDFIDSIGEVLLTGTKVKIKKNSRLLGSSSGELKKKWYIDDNGKRILVKGNIGKSYQQSLNEVFISRIHQQLNKKYFLKYEEMTIEVDGGRTIIGCKTEDFCSEKVEFISASEIIDGRKLSGSDNPFNSFKEGCLELGMKEKEFDDYMDYLIMTDYLFTNIDRHLNNIGILRNPDALSLIGFSPIFDSGSSMFYNLSLQELEKINLSNVKINSFFNTEKKMLNHVKNPHIIDLNHICPDFSIYRKDIAEEQKRYGIIEQLFYKKLETLKEFQKRKN